MSSVSATTSGTSDIAANPAGYTVKAPKKVLGAEDFMTLLATQMNNQDPLKPMEDTAFVSQMASFTSLSQMNNLVSSFNSMKTEQSKVGASNYIGRTVTVASETSSTGYVTGEVTGVDFTGDEPMLKIGGNFYGVSTVQSVAATAAKESTTTTG